MLFFPGEDGWATVRHIQNVRFFELDLDGRITKIVLEDGSSPDIDLGRVLRWQELPPRRQS